jgi:DNA-binding transcriptional MocR family regulator
VSPSVVIGAAGPAVRRQVGPLAWVVLEVAMSVGSDRVATVSARSVAAELGVSKDTAARALRRLAAGGLIGRLERRGGGGRFVVGRYGLHVTPDVLSLTEPKPAAMTPTLRRADTAQLSLLQSG